MSRSSRRAVTVFLPLLAACAGSTGLAADASLAVPRCSGPAPLLGEYDPAAPGYIVVFRDGVSGRAETARLASRYGFEPVHVYEFALSGFSADLPARTLLALRCESTVRYIEHDGIATIASGTSSTS